MTVSDAAAIVGQLLPEPQAGLLAGILFGIKASMSQELYDALITTGTLHIVALSGQNISILIGLVSVILLRMVRRPIANIMSLAIIIGFIWFVGPSPSVIRAGVMGGITLIGISLGRQIWPLVIWTLAVAIMLVRNPLWIGDLSFQLSAMATLGILLFGAKRQLPVIYPHEHEDDNMNLKAIVSKARQALSDDLRITLAAQVFTVPIIMFAFGRISLVSPLSNLLIGWLIAPIMTLGFLLVTLGFVWVPLAQVVGWFVWVPLTFVIHVIELTSRIPFASIGL